MNEIYSWSKMITFVSIISAMVTLIVPENGIKKAYRTFMTVILMFSLLYPLSGNKEIYQNFSELLSQRAEMTDESEIESYKNMPMIYSAQSEAEKYLAERFIASGIDASCSVKCSVKNNFVYIDTVTVKTNADNKALNQILEYTEEICSEESVIIINGEIYGE